MTTASGTAKRILTASSSGEGGGPHKKQMFVMPSSVNIGNTRLCADPSLYASSSGSTGMDGDTLLLQQLQLEHINARQMQLMRQMQQRQQQVLHQLAMARSLQAGTTVPTTSELLGRPPFVGSAMGASWMNLGNLTGRRTASPSSAMMMLNMLARSGHNDGVGVSRGPPSPSSSCPVEVAASATWTTADPIPVCLPAVVQGSNPHWQDRTIVSLATDEDANWLSEYQCFLRGQVLEVFHASAEDLMVRNNSKSLHVGQVGVRCRFCAHVAARARAPRSSAFPSSIGQIYQSFTMMLREHFGHCSATPLPLQDRLDALRKENLQGASDAKKYWVHAAQKMGLFDTPDHGMDITDASRLRATRIPPFGSSPEDHSPTSMAATRIALVSPQETRHVPRYLQMLFEHVQVVTLAKSERVGNRKTLAKELPGLGCMQCALKGRLGLCRVFPARRRALPAKVEDLYEHLKRCPLIAVQEQDLLVRLHDEYQQQKDHHKEQHDAQELYEREFFHCLWAKLGHSSKSQED